jgi:hypothetical protein
MGWREIFRTKGPHQKSPPNRRTIRNLSAGFCFSSVAFLLLLRHRALSALSLFIIAFTLSLLLSL